MINRKIAVATEKRIDNEPGRNYSLVFSLVALEDHSCAAINGRMRNFSVCTACARVNDVHNYFGNNDSFVTA